MSATEEIRDLLSMVRPTRTFYDRVAEQVDRTRLTYGDRSNDALEVLRICLHEAVDLAVDRGREDDQDGAAIPVHFDDLVDFWKRHRCGGPGE